MNKTLIGGLVIVILAGVGGWYWTQSDTTPDSTPAAAYSTEQPAVGAPMVEVIVPAEFSALASQGETYFNAVCASCHGANAAGQDGVAPPFIHPIYEPNHHGDAAFLIAARSGVRAHHWSFGDMPPIEQALSDAELGAIIAYVRALQRANGIN